MAVDCNSLATALQIGAVFLPEDSGQNRYFADAARDLFTGNIEALMQLAPGRWTLRELIIASRSREIMEDLLSRCPTTRDRAAYFQDDKTFSSIPTTLTSRLAPLGVVAACWDRARYRISLNGWARSESILGYGSDETTRFATDAIAVKAEPGNTRPQEAEVESSLFAAKCLPPQPTICKSVRGTAKEILENHAAAFIGSCRLYW